MLIALASPGAASTFEEGLGKVERLMAEASAQGAEIVCFPEAYLPGLRGQDFAVYPFDRAQQERELVNRGQLVVIEVLVARHFLLTDDIFRTVMPRLVSGKAVFTNGAALVPLEVF